MRAAAPVLAATAMLAAAGCASLDTTEQAVSADSFEAHRRELQSVANWEMRGRIAIDTGAEARQGRFTWLQDGASLRLIVRGPLGAGAMEIRGNGETLTMRSRRETHTLTDPELQLSEMLGWWLPITSLQSWLLGLPDERYARAAATIDSGLLRDLEQRAWRVRFEDYARHGEFAIPSRIVFAHTPLELIVTIDEWLPQAAPNLELEAGRRAQ